MTELQTGLQTGWWERAKEIQAWLQQTYQTQLSVKGVYYWLGKLGGVLKVPRKAHALQTPGAAAFQQALEEALGEELRPIYQSAERVRAVVSHPWLADQVNPIAPENSTNA